MLKFDLTLDEEQNLAVDEFGMGKTLRPRTLSVSPSLQQNQLVQPSTPSLRPNNSFTSSNDFEMYAKQSSSSSSTTTRRRTPRSRGSCQTWSSTASRSSSRGSRGSARAGLPPRWEEAPSATPPTCRRCRRRRSLTTRPVRRPCRRRQTLRRRVPMWSRLLRGRGRS